MANTNIITDYGVKIGGARKDNYVDSIKHFDKMSKKDYITLAQKIGNKKAALVKALCLYSKNTNMYVIELNMIINDMLASDKEVDILATELLSQGYVDYYKTLCLLGFPTEVYDTKNYCYEKNFNLYDPDDRYYSVFKLNKNRNDYKSHTIGEKDIKGYIMSLLDNKTKKSTKFVIYTNKKGDMWIAPNGKPRIIVKRCKTEEEMRSSYIREHQEELDVLYQKIKKLPDTRHKTNRERVGEDYRKGRDITVEEFSNTFGFKGIEFGNYESQKDRQTNLNRTYDAFNDLASVLGIEKEDISHRGELSLAFGSRGIRGASAHYEPDKKVINLTKEKGAGTLAHEWFHSLDNNMRKDYLSERCAIDYVSESTLSNDTKRTDGKTIDGEDIYTMMKTLFEKTDRHAQRCYNRDVYGSKKYYFTRPERIARIFEVYVHTLLKERDIKDDYLVNYMSYEDYKNSFEDKDDNDTYVYLLDDEMEDVMVVMDKMMRVIFKK